MLRILANVNTDSGSTWTLLPILRIRCSRSGFGVHVGPDWFATHCFCLSTVYPSAISGGDMAAQRTTMRKIREILRLRLAAALSLDKW